MTTAQPLHIQRLSPGMSFVDIDDHNQYLLLEKWHNGQSYVLKVQDYSNGVVYELYYDEHDQFIELVDPPEMPHHLEISRTSRSLYCKYTKLKLALSSAPNVYREISGASFEEVLNKTKSYNKRFDDKVTVFHNSIKDQVLIRL